MPWPNYRSGARKRCGIAKTAPQAHALGRSNALDELIPYPLTASCEGWDDDLSKKEGRAKASSPFLRNLFV